MDRVSGWYKRKAQLFIFGWAFAVILSVNADTTLIANTLAPDATLRASLVVMAKVTAKEALPKNAGQAKDRIKQLSTEIELLELPIGWSLERNDPMALERSPQENGIALHR
jgi:hypothetical protein